MAYSCPSAPAMLLFKISCATLAVLFTDGASAATTHTVGGSSGWIIPAAINMTFYQDWASTKTFSVGDKLVFTFKTGSHDVTQVRKSSYGSCSTAGAVGKAITAGPATVTLTTAGTHYYICGFPGHCDGGQKVAITVLAGSSAPPAEAPTAGAGEPSATNPPTAEGPTTGGPSVGAPSVAGIGISTTAVGFVTLLLI